MDTTRSVIPFFETTALNVENSSISNLHGNFSVCTKFELLVNITT